MLLISSPYAYFETQVLIFRNTDVITADRNSPVGGRIYETLSTVAKPHFDVPGCTIHVAIHYIIPVSATVFLKMNSRIRKT